MVESELQIVPANISQNIPLKRSRQLLRAKMAEKLKCGDTFKLFAV
jgi:hypothetical protein